MNGINWPTFGFAHSVSAIGAMYERKCKYRDNCMNWKFKNINKWPLQLMVVKLVLSQAENPDYEGDKDKGS
jgi:hypothetical protein